MGSLAAGSKARSRHTDVGIRIETITINQVVAVAEIIIGVSHVSKTASVHAHGLSEDAEGSVQIESKVLG